VKASLLAEDLELPGALEGATKEYESPLFGAHSGWDYLEVWYADQVSKHSA